MKFIHTADVHLDSPLTGLSSEKAKQRRGELFDSFAKVVLYARNNDIHVIAISGDLFDENKLTKRTRDKLFALINKNPDIDFIYSLGNHDEKSLEGEEEIPTNLYLGANEWKSRSYGNVVFTYANFNNFSEKFLYDTLNLQSDKKNIVMLHGETTDFNETGKIHLKKLRNKNIDYLALGHIHMRSYDKLDERGYWGYCGCLEGRGFDEEGPKGFYVIDTDNIDNPLFIDNSIRKIHRCNISITGAKNWLEYEDKVIQEIKPISKDDIVEVIITGNYDISLVNEKERIYNYIMNHYFFGKVKDISKLDLKPEDYVNSSTFKGMFIKNVLDDKTLTDEEKRYVIEKGIHALMGEEL